MNVEMDGRYACVTIEYMAVCKIKYKRKWKCMNEYMNICVKERNDNVNEQMHLHTYVMNTDIARTIWTIVWMYKWISVGI